MRGIDVAAQVVGSRQCVIFRARPDGEYDVKNIAEQGRNKSKKEGWVILDLFTASAILTVWDALSAENRAKLERMPLQRMADVAWKLAL